VPYFQGLLCVLQGGEYPTVVSVSGGEHKLNAWSLARHPDNGSIIAGANDGNIYELVSGAWTKLTLMPLGGRVMAVAFYGGYMWATTDGGDLWVILSDGQAQRVHKGAGHYSNGSWFGPRFGMHDGALHVSVKVKSGSSWQCVVYRLEVTA
jgi:hypothetical protein